MTADFAPEEYLRLQALVYGVAATVREERGSGKMYLYTFGNKSGNAHVHWRVVPPPGAPYEDQQGAWAGWDKGVLEIPQQEMFELAGRIGRRL